VAAAAPSSTAVYTIEHDHLQACTLFLYIYTLWSLLAEAWAAATILLALEPVFIYLLLRLLNTFTHCYAAVCRRAALSLLAEYLVAPGRLLVRSSGGWDI